MPEVYHIKKPEMFATFAYLAWNGEQLEYSLAGHPAILHYHAATKEISELSSPNLPLGLFDQQQFLSGLVPFAPGDLFLLLTDGLLEVADIKDEEFGLAGVRGVMSKHAGNPIDAIFQEILETANHHGHAADDKSMLLIRCHVSAPYF